MTRSVAVTRGERGMLARTEVLEQCESSRAQEHEGAQLPHSAERNGQAVAFHRIGVGGRVELEAGLDGLQFFLPVHLRIAADTLVAREPAQGQTWAGVEHCDLDESC